MAILIGTFICKWYYPWILDVKFMDIILEQINSSADISTDISSIPLNTKVRDTQQMRLLQSCFNCILLEAFDDHIQKQNLVWIL